MKSLVIKNYKNIREIEIDSLAPVNLIVGRNNVGKSTLLEAISIYAADGDINWLKQILEMRGELTRRRYSEDVDINREIGSFLSFFHNREYDFSDDKKICIGQYKKQSCDNSLFDGVSIRIVRFKDEIINDENGSIRKRIVLEGDDEKESDYKVALEVFVGGDKILYPLGRRSNFVPMNKKVMFEYIQTSTILRDKNANLWDKIALTSKENYIIKALQIVEPLIDRINFVDENPIRNSGERVPVVTLKGRDERYHLSSMGDGINRILTIILALVSCENGIFLLDEFENGLHYSVQKQLWNIIFSLSKKLNIQVFVTTHSNDCIAGFAAVNITGRGKLIRLENREGRIVGTSYNNDRDIKFAIDQDIEIR